MLSKGMPSLFIIISSIESIAKKKLKKKTALPHRMIPSPGIEAYNGSLQGPAPLLNTLVNEKQSGISARPASNLTCFLHQTDWTFDMAGVP